MPKMRKMDEVHWIFFAQHVHIMTKNVSIHHAVDAKLFKNAKKPILSTLAGSDHNKGTTYPKRIKPQTERMFFQSNFPYPYVLRIECKRYKE